MTDNETMIKLDDVSKIYKLGEIGGTTLVDTFQRLKAKILRKEDPTRKIGAKNYNKGEKFKALDHINLTIKKGERVGIIGHNGAGKSTLLKLICRVTAPTCGEIGLNGRLTSMLEVGTGFHPDLTGRENIYMNGAILGMSKKEINEVIEDIIDFSEVREFIDTPVKRYSSGMYVKLAFSVAAHLKSEIMIMDEVLAVGDVVFQKKCLRKMSSLSKNKGKTLLYVSHNMNTIRNLCNRVIVLKQGKIIYDGEVEKGINLYMNNNSSRESVIDCKSIKRGPQVIGSVFLESISFLDKNIPVFDKEDFIKLGMNWKSIITTNQLKIRITLLSGAEEPIFSAVSPCITDVIPGEYNLVFELEISRLAPSPYLMNIDFIDCNVDGEEKYLDSVGKICYFEKVASVGDNWNISWWGFVRNVPINILSNEKIDR